MIKKNTEPNHRPVSILANISKIYKMYIFSQISNCFEKVIPRNQYGSRKGYSTRQCQFVMIKKRRAL